MRVLGITAIIIALVGITITFLFVWSMDWRMKNIEWEMYQMQKHYYSEQEL